MLGRGAAEGGSPPRAAAEEGTRGKCRGSSPGARGQCCARGRAPAEPRAGAHTHSWGGTAPALDPFLCICLDWCRRNIFGLNFRDFCCYFLSKLKESSRASALCFNYLTDDKSAFDIGNSAPRASSAPLTCSQWLWYLALTRSSVQGKCVPTLSYGISTSYFFMSKLLMKYVDIQTGYSDSRLVMLFTGRTSVT